MDDLDAVLSEGRGRRRGPVFRLLHGRRLRSVGAVPRPLVPPDGVPHLLDLAQVLFEGGGNDVGVKVPLVRGPYAEDLEVDGLRSGRRRRRGRFALKFSLAVNRAQVRQCLGLVCTVPVGL